MPKQGVPACSAGVHMLTGVERVGGEFDLRPEEGREEEVGNPFRTFQLAGNQNQTTITYI